MIEDAVLKKAANQCGGDYSSLKLLGGLNESVYNIKINEENFVIKFFSADQIDRSLIKGQLDWINYLAEAGMNVAEPMFSLQEQPIEEVRANGSLYYYVLFEKVAGSLISEQGWKEELIQNWGRAMGKMHNLAKDYTLSDEGKIEHCAENDLLKEPPNSASDLVLKKWNDYVKTLTSLPTSKDCYGVIHNDLHHKNFYVKDGEVQLFDFGGCEFSWFSYDIAISLYHAVQDVSLTEEKEEVKFADKFLWNFMEGYRLENSLAKEWIEKIPFFLDYRQLYSYLYILKHVPEKDINQGVQEMLEGMKYRIKNDISYIPGFEVESAFSNSFVCCSRN